MRPTPTHARLDRPVPALPARVRTRWLRLGRGRGPVLTGLALVALAWPAVAQDTRRAYASRSELEASLAEIEQVVRSPGYSQRLRTSKRKEQQLIRQRLADGDLQVGDKIAIQVEGVTEYTDTFTVGPGRILTLPGGLTVPVQGVLRAEADSFFAAQMGRVVRNPSVQVKPMIRLSVLGQVGNPGFYHLPADILVSDAIMAAGGPLGGADPGKTRVRRSGAEIVSPIEFKEVLASGLTLDQMNLRAGDELIVETIRVRQGFGVGAVIAAASLVSSLSFLLFRIF